MKIWFMGFLLIGLISLGISGCGGGGGGNSSVHAQTIQTSTIDVLSGIWFITYENTEYDGVAAISCPTGMVAVSAGCSCGIPKTGPIFSLSIVAQSSSICGCTPTDFNIYDDEVKVSVVCAQAVNNKAVSSVILKKEVIEKREEEKKQKEEELEEKQKLLLEKLSN